jgi:two-component SAPR family response regulator
MTNDKPLKGRRILVVEDDYLIAEIVTEMLQDAGAAVLGPFGWRDEALAFINHNSADFDAALLDINLHGQVSYPIADALIERDIHFAFTTGYGAGVLEEAYRSYQRCEKPFQQQTLMAALNPVSG